MAKRKEVKSDALDDFVNDGYTVYVFRLRRRAYPYAAALITDIDGEERQVTDDVGGTTIAEAIARLEERAQELGEDFIIEI